VREFEIDQDPDSEKEIHANLYRLVSSDLVRTQIETSQAKWVAKPGGLDLDIAFVRNEGKNGLGFVGMSMCGKDNVVGVQLRRGKQGVDGGLRSIGRDTDLSYIEERGGKILVMTPTEIKQWVNYYEHVEKNGWVDYLGHRAYEHSGLEWLSEREYGQLSMTLSQIIEQEWSTIQSRGVSQMNQYGEIDVVFGNKKGQTSTMPISHVRRREFSGVMAVEQVLDAPIDCVGFVLQQIGEKKYETEMRAQNISARLTAEHNHEMRVLPVDMDQVSLWKKMGMTREWGAIDERAELSVEEVVRWLYMGQSNIEPGQLALPPLSLSLPGNGEMFTYQNVDFLFGRTQDKGSYQVSPVDNWLVFDKRGKEVCLSNVVGIRIFPNDVEFDERNSLMKQVRKDLEYRSGVPGAYILNLDRNLFEIWKERGTPFLSDSEAEQIQASLQKRKEYFMGMGGPVTRVDYAQFRQKAEIGGDKKAIVLSDNAGNVRFDILDAGLSFSDMPEGYAGIGKDPNTADGLLTLFRFGVLPMIPAWWDKEYLMQTAKRMNNLRYGSEIEADPVAQFVLAELYSRVPSGDLKAALPHHVVRKINEYGPRIAQEWWGGKNISVGKFSPTHAHWDHVGSAPYLDADIGAVLSGPTSGFFQAISAKASSWRRILTHKKLISQEKQGAAYGIKTMDIEKYFYSFQPVRFSPEVTMYPIFVPHSIPANSQYVTIETPSGAVSLFNSGDWLVNSEGEPYHKMSALAGKPDVIIMDGTNADSRKAYLGKTEVDVRDTFHKVVQDARGEVIVVVAPINNLARLKTILDVAEFNGRKLALGFSHAELQMQMAAAAGLAPIDAEGFEDVLPYELGEENLTVWSKSMTNPRSYHKALMDLAGRGNLGLLDSLRLSRENGKWIVVVSPYDKLSDQFDGIRVTKGMKLVYMASYPYSHEQKTFLGANRDWLRRSPHNTKLVTDLDIYGLGGRVTSRLSEYGVLHVSGHATPNEMVVMTDILVGSDRKQIPVIINHSESPESLGKLLTERMGDRVKPITQFSAYNPQDPRRYPGYYFRLI
jgi:hypothetical protein